MHTCETILRLAKHRLTMLMMVGMLFSETGDPNTVLVARVQYGTLLSISIRLLKQVSGT